MPSIELDDTVDEHLFVEEQVPIKFFIQYDLEQEDKERIVQLVEVRDTLATTPAAEHQ
jgi:hypothetical protein